MRKYSFANDPNLEHYRSFLKKLAIEGEYEEVIRFIKRIGEECVSLQYHLILTPLLNIAIGIISKQNPDFEAVITCDKIRYELFVASYGSNYVPDKGCILYYDAETGFIDNSLEKLILEVVPQDNILMKFYDEIRKKTIEINQEP